MRAFLSVAMMAVITMLVGCYSSFEGEPKAGPSTQDKQPKSPKKKAEKKKEPEQTYKEAWQVICHAKRLSGGDDSQIVEWILSHLKNKKARYWFIALGNVKREHKLAHFRHESHRAGFASCPSEPLLFPAPSSNPSR